MQLYENVTNKQLAMLGIVSNKSLSLSLFLSLSSSLVSVSLYIYIYTLEYILWGCIMRASIYFSSLSSDFSVYLQH